MATTVQVQNRENAMRAYHLEHAGVCIPSGKCFCSKMVRMVPVKMGAESGLKRIEKIVPATVTFLALETRAVQEHELLSSEMQAAIKSGKLRRLK